MEMTDADFNCIEVIGDLIRNGHRGANLEICFRRRVKVSTQLAQAWLR
jgi:hypothetical protein